jgi:uncharacterized protein YycO
VNVENAKNAIIQFAQAQVGKKYDYRGIFGFLARKESQGGDRWFCSELVAACFWAAQIPLVRDFPHKVAPSDLKRSPLLTMFAMSYTRTGSTVPAPGEGQLRVALYLGLSAVSKAIEWRTWSDYSHASLILPDNTVVESLPLQGVVHHPHISELHTDRTCIEIFTVNWDAALLCRAANPQGTVNAND